LDHFSFCWCALDQFNLDLLILHQLLLLGQVVVEWAMRILSFEFQLQLKDLFLRVLLRHGHPSDRLLLFGGLLHHDPVSRPAYRVSLLLIECLQSDPLLPSLLKPDEPVLHYVGHRGLLLAERPAICEILEPIKVAQDALLHFAIT